MAFAKRKPSAAHRSDCHERLNGRLISDPYRWMEEDTPELRRWVEEQHEYTMAQLSSLPACEGIRRRLEQLMRTPARGAITRAGKRYFFQQRFEDQELSALYCQDAPHGEPQLLLDPNELSSDHSITLSDTHPSGDGSLVAYRLSL